MFTSKDFHLHVPKFLFHIFKCFRYNCCESIFMCFFLFFPIETKRDCWYGVLGFILHWRHDWSFTLGSNEYKATRFGSSEGWNFKLAGNFLIFLVSFSFSRFQVQASIHNGYKTFLLSVWCLEKQRAANWQVNWVFIASDSSVILQSFSYYVISFLVLQIAESLPRICFLSGLSGEEMLMFIEAFPETGIRVKKYSS